MKITDVYGDTASFQWAGGVLILTAQQDDEEVQVEFSPEDVTALREFLSIPGPLV